MQGLLQRTQATIYLKLITKVIALVIVLGPGCLYAQQAKLTNADKNDRLDVIHSALEAKVESRKNLRDAIAIAPPDDLPELEIGLAEINQEITSLRDTFEQLAVGSTDLAVFNSDPTEIDWRYEVGQIMMPIMENLKSLTEKPRKIQAQKSLIDTRNEQLQAISTALKSIEEQIATSTNDNTKQALQSLLSNWSDKKLDTERAIELAKLQLINLQKNDQSLWISLKTGVVDFLKGRGLTIILAILAAILVWLLMRLITNFLSKKSKKEDQKEFKTRQRIVHYAFKAVTALLILTAVIIVFYIRGDVLLMGVAFLFAAAIVLGLRNTIPKFISETRLLLNLGAIREDERVIYNGLPYRVVTLNMFSVLRNPELSGVIRLPLEHMVSMISRPAGKEIWFPSSKDDYLLFDDGRMLRVIEQTTELVHLETLAGTKTSIPTTDFFNATFDNISRGDRFSVVGVFGIGYAHQDISNTVIPTKIQAALVDAFAGSAIAQSVEKIAVELKEAGASSLDYWACITLKSDAAPSYYKALRIIQQTCVDTCSQEKWDIPFPQLTLHRE
jgi:small-conductance mechanosensitive channel